ncbi:MAG: VCBS repeat-containing protein [SAR324 cluster bacterium]|nr:VCBS repeat-containing protein [SAR324 cluster bacterium]
MPLIRLSILLVALSLGLMTAGCRPADVSDLAPEDLKRAHFLSRPSPLRSISSINRVPEETPDVEFISLKVPLYDSFSLTSANLIVLGNGETILVDYSESNFIEESIIPFLKRRGILQIDHLISTHFHKGNVDVSRGSGLETLITQFSVKRIYSAPLAAIRKYPKDEQQNIQALLAKAQEQGIVWETLLAGDQLSFWERRARLEVLSAYNHESAEASTLNLRFEYQDFSILFLQSTRNEDLLELAKRKSNVASTLLVMPHDPPDYQIYAPLFEAIDPVMIIVPFSGMLFESKDFNTDHLQFLNHWRSRGIPTLPIAWYGNIGVQTDGNTASYYNDRDILLENVLPPLSLFTDVTEEAGLDGNQSIGIWGDYNGDGYQDYYTHTNNGDGTFTENEQLASSIENSRGISWGDLNGDGRLDLFGTYYQSSTLFHPYVEQQPDGSFLNKFQEYFEGLQQDTIIEHWSGETNAWADVDGDGDLDLFVPWYHYQDPGKSFLFINDYPSLKMEEEERGVAPPLDDHLWPRVEGVHFADLNGDDYLDLYTTSQLFINDGTGYFNDHREAWGAPIAPDEGIYLFDFDSDGDLDLFINSPKPYLLRNLGERFEDISWESGIEALEVFPFAWQHVFFDYDLDGDPDLIWIGKDPEIEKQFLYFLENQGDGNFSTIRLLGEVPHGGLGYADYDLDGDLDLGIGGGILWRNNWMENHPETPKPMRVKVISPEGHFTEFSTSVLLYTYNEDGTLIQQPVQVIDGGSGYLQQNQYALHFPVQESRSYELEIRPPTGIQRGSRRFRTERIAGSFLIGKTIIIGEDGIHSIDPY